MPMLAPMASRRGRRCRPARTPRPAREPTLGTHRFARVSVELRVLAPHGVEQQDSRAAARTSGAFHQNPRCDACFGTAGRTRLRPLEDLACGACWVCGAAAAPAPPVVAVALV